MKIQRMSDLLAAEKKARAAREALEAQRQSRREQQEQRDRDRLVAQRQEQLASIGLGLSMSYAAYIDADATRAYLSQIGFDEGSYERITTWFGAEGFCCLRERRAYLCFAGTDSLFDVVVDVLGCMPCYWPLVHSGFGASWYALKKKRVAAWLSENRDEFDDISLYGHSLGGAISHVAALDLASYYTLREVISFGAPRSVFWRTSEEYNVKLSQGCDKTLREQTLRVVHGSDLVSRLPLATMGYRHVGRLAYMSYSGAVYFDEQAEQIKKDESLRGQVSSWLDRFRRFDRSAKDAITTMTSTPLIGAPHKISFFGRVWLAISLADMGFPFVKSTLFALAALFVPVGIFLAGVSDFALSSLSHPMKRYYSYFPGENIRQKLVSTPRSGLGRLMAGLAKVMTTIIKTSLIVGAVAGVLYGVFWISVRTLIPGLASVPDWFE